MSQIKDILVALICMLAICCGIFLGFMSPFISAFIYDKYFNSTLIEEYYYTFETISIDKNKFLSPYASISSQASFENLTLNFFFDVGNIVYLEDKKDLNIIYSIKIKDYETSENVYSLEFVYTDVYLPGSKNKHKNSTIVFKNISLENKKYIFELVYYEADDIDNVYKHKAIMKPGYSSYTIKLFDILMST